MAWEFCPECRPMTRKRCTTGCPRVTAPHPSTATSAMSPMAMALKYLRITDTWPDEDMEEHF